MRCGERPWSRGTRLHRMHEYALEAGESHSKCIFEMAEMNSGLTDCLQVLAVDLLNPTPQAEARKHKLKTLVPGPRSFFMDVKCPGCFTITTVFSHAQTVVVCAGCSQVLCQPTGGKARLTEGCSFRRK
ncbi:hypothetical protein PRZ48_013735 [Zasmidium cellare]|uniref:40S ribosomal protein S27 n=1 Tax=Zasmidium cellare TaxID=395010 RepID=A0ABR0E248_ZASCE|nr:hypothetical protein PRZ48_013735 [Zasmidium cellare]